MPSTSPAPRRSAKKKLEEAAKQPEEVQIPGVAVLRVPTEDGKYEFRLSVLGGLDQHAIPSVLEYGLIVARQTLGLGDSK